VTPTDIVLHFSDAFDEVAIPYMVVGSYSSNVYGRPRSRHNADFVLQLNGKSIPALPGIFGPEFEIEPQMPFESATATMRYVASHKASEFKVKMFLLTNDPHDAARFQRRQLVDFRREEGLASHARGRRDYQASLVKGRQSK
jgi:hypothetical protein